MLFRFDRRGDMTLVASYKGNIEFFLNAQVEGNSQREQTIAIANCSP